MKITPGDWRKKHGLARLDSYLFGIGVGFVIAGPIASSHPNSLAILLWIAATIFVIALGILTIIVKKKLL